jgi:hypothetical protein
MFRVNAPSARIAVKCSAATVAGRDQSAVTCGAVRQSSMSGRDEAKYEPARSRATP